MKSILLIGLGRFGRHIAIKLHELRHQVMAVDWREECVEAALPYVTSAQIGDSKNEEFMASLGVRNFDVCIVAIGDDFQSSLETTSLLKDLGARFVVARAARDVHAKFLLRNGADEVVYPEKQLAAWTAIRYSSDHIFDYIELNADHAIVEVAVPEAWPVIRAQPWRPSMAATWPIRLRNLQGCRAFRALCWGAAQRGAGGCPAAFRSPTG